MNNPDYAHKVTMQAILRRRCTEFISEDKHLKLLGKKPTLCVALGSNFKDCYDLEKAINVVLLCNYPNVPNADAEFVTPNTDVGHLHNLQHAENSLKDERV